MVRKFPFLLIALLALIVGLYPAIYFFADPKFGLLQSKSDALLSSKIWKAAFFLHILPGGLALLIGWIQFVRSWRNKNISLHRLAGKIYVLAVLVSAVAGIYIGFYATGGWIPAAGFICLGVAWFATTLKAYSDIRSLRIIEHEQMMIYSYSLCMAAVTLRIYLPLLQILFGDFIIAYSIVAWLCWIPNLFVAYLIVREKNRIHPVLIRK